MASIAAANTFEEREKYPVSVARYGTNGLYLNQRRFDNTLEAEAHAEAEALRNPGQRFVIATASRAITAVPPPAELVTTDIRRV